MPAEDAPAAEAVLPSVSIIIPTLNAGADLQPCLQAIAAQDYPASLLEVLVMDGGSTDHSVAIAQAFGCRVIVEANAEGYASTADARMGLGIRQARHEIVALIMADNWMPYPGWLREMVAPLAADPAIVGSTTLRYHHRRDASVLERYFALIGVGDPVAYYLNRRDRISWAEQSLPYRGAIEECPGYYRVRFDREGLPPLGGNGTLIRRAALDGLETDPALFGHSDAMQELVNRGENTFAIVNTTIIHVYRGSWLDEIRKRARFYRVYGPHTQPRRYRLFDGRRAADRRALARFVLFALTGIRPLRDAWRGYRAVRDPAWFLHPLHCFGMTLAYGATVLPIAWSRFRRQVIGTANQE